MLSAPNLWSLLLLLCLGAGTLIGYILSSRISAHRISDLDALWAERLEADVERRLSEKTRELRRDAAMRSGKVLSGKVIETFAPFLTEFPFDPHDAVWLGSPVDFVVFDGISEDRERGSRLRRVVFVEVKTAHSGLSMRQKMVRKAIEEGRVEWREIRIRG